MKKICNVLAKHFVIVFIIMQILMLSIGLVLGLTYNNFIIIAIFLASAVLLEICIVLIVFGIADVDNFGG